MTLTNRIEQEVGIYATKRTAIDDEAISGD